MSDNTQKLSHNEVIKEANPTLAGTIAQTLEDPAVDRFVDDDTQFLKFHGIYQQDDRDVRKTGKKFMFMVRTKFPGGVLTGDQYLVCDELATKYANNTIRATTRQGFQFHGIIKSGLRQTIKELNESLVSTIAACGDVERNVMAPPTPATSSLVDQVLDCAADLARVLCPQTPAYHRIWVEGKPLDLNADTNRDFVDPLYGKTYLPRKFKTGLAIPPLNDTDIFTNDLGFVAIAEDGRLVGFNILVGGGMGMTHGNEETFPRLADILGFIKPEHMLESAKTVVTIHRDFGDRANRKHARLKYVLEDRGVKWFREEFERRAGIQLEPARPFTFDRQGDLLGWHRQTNGKYFLGLFVENGRIQDADGRNLKSGLRQVVESFRPQVRVTPSQNVLLIDIPEEQRDEMSRMLHEHGVSTSNPFSRSRLASMACPALPTCGLALAESERVLPDILTGFEGLLNELGLKDEEIIIRMTGCPNGCARPFMAEIALVGRAPNKYHLFLGGNESSTRLNRLFKQNVKSDEILTELKSVLARFAQERNADERFGDWSHRALWSEDEVASLRN